MFPQHNLLTWTHAPTLINNTAHLDQKPMMLFFLFLPSDTHTSNPLLNPVRPTSKIFLEVIAYHHLHSIYFVQTTRNLGRNVATASLSSVIPILSAPHRAGKTFTIAIISLLTKTHFLENTSKFRSVAYKVLYDSGPRSFSNPAVTIRPFSDSAPAPSPA